MRDRFDEAADQMAFGQYVQSHKAIFEAFRNALGQLGWDLIQKTENSDSEYCLRDPWGKVWCCGAKTIPKILERGANGFTAFRELAMRDENEVWRRVAKLCCSGCRAGLPEIRYQNGSVDHDTPAGKVECWANMLRKENPEAFR